ncbi:MAG: ABC transporter permease [Eubacterium sp.]|nr:ABC transporter permease [Eubacterium sp.]
MKQFKIIFNHELAEYMKNKAFVGFTLVIVAVILVVMFWPRFFSGNGEEGEKSVPKVGIVTEGGVDAELVKAIMEGDPSFSDREIEIKEDASSLEAGVLDSSLESGYLIKDLKSYTYVVANRSMVDNMEKALMTVMEKMNFASAMKDKGASTDEIKAAADVVITPDIKTLKSDQVSNYLYAYIMIFALYIIIMLYGSMVATSVASEKSSRAMEVLITSAKPNSLMFGKILAACAAGMGQLILIFGAAFAGYQINATYWDDKPVIGSIFNIPLNMILLMLLFFLLGFLLYAMLYGAVGSMATKVEDVSTLQTPIMFLFIIGFFIVVMNIGTNVNSTIMVVASYFPFTSPMAMFSRIVLGDIAVYEVIISVAILIVSVGFFGVLAARIYRAGVLTYGKTPKFSDVIAAGTRKPE